MTEEDLAFFTSQGYLPDASQPPDGRLTILDVSDPYSPVEIGHVAGILEAGSLAVTNGFAYVSNGHNGGLAELQIVDVNNPHNPIVAATISSTYFEDIAAWNEQLYLVGGVDGLRILDLSNPVQPMQVGQYPLPEGYSGYSIVTAQENLVYVKVNDFDYGSSLHILDTSNPAAPQLVAYYDLPHGGGNGKGIQLSGNFIFLSSQAAGLATFWFPVPVVRTVPVAGGDVAIPYDQTHYHFATDTFTETVVLTHTAVYPDHVPPTGDLVGIWHFFENTAVFSGTHTLAQPTQPYTLTIEYLDMDRQTAVEDTLALYYWDGTAWVREASSTVNTATNAVTATPNRFGLWAVLGETNRSYLPVLVRP